MRTTRTVDVSFTPAEVAVRLRVSVRRIVRLAVAGAIPCHVGRDGSIRFAKGELVGWIAGLGGQAVRL